MSRSDKINVQEKFLIPEQNYKIGKLVDVT